VPANQTVTLTAQTGAVGFASYTLKFPTTQGTSGQVLTTNGASPAILSWTTVSSPTNAFTQGGNAGFGPPAVLGTTDTAPLTIGTAIGLTTATAGNITIQPGNGTTAGGALNLYAGGGTTNGAGSAVNILGGSGAGVGAAGNVSIDTGSGTGTPAITIGGTNASVVNIATAATAQTVNIGFGGAGVTTINLGGAGDSVLVNTNKFTIDGTTGNTLIAGSLTANGGITTSAATGLTINTGTTGNLTLRTGTTGTISMDPGGAAGITIGGTNANAINVGHATGSPTYFVGAGAGGDQTTASAPNAYLDATTGQLMRSTSTVLANAYVRGGNSFGGDSTLGLNDSLGGTAGYGLTIQTASLIAPLSTAGNITIQPGTGTTAGGSVIIDTGAGGSPTVTIGGTNATGVNVSRTGQLTDVLGNLTVGGDAINLATGANANAKTVNIATLGTALGSSAINLGSTLNTSTIKVGQNANDAVSVTGNLTLATPGNQLVFTGTNNVPANQTVTLTAQTGAVGFASYTLKFPTTQGTSGQVLTTNGASPAILSWTTVSSPTNAFVQGGQAFAGVNGVLGMTDSIGGLGVTGTSLSIQTSAGFPTSGSITIQPGTLGAGAPTTGGALTLRSGNGSGAAGTVTLDTGTWTSGTPTITIGGTNAITVNIATRGGAVAKTVNIATSGTAAGSSAITVGSLSNKSTIKLGQNSADIVAVAGSIEGSTVGTGIVNIATGLGAGSVPLTTQVNIATVLTTAPQAVYIGNSNGANSTVVNIDGDSANFLNTTVVNCSGRLNADGGLEAENTSTLNIADATNISGLAVTGTINIGTATSTAGKTITIGNAGLIDAVTLNALTLNVTAPTNTFVNAITANGGVIAGGGGNLDLGVDAVTNTINIGNALGAFQVINIGSGGTSVKTITMGTSSDSVGIGGAPGTGVLTVTGNSLFTGPAGFGNVQIDGNVVLPAASTSPTTGFGVVYRGTIASGNQFIHTFGGGAQNLAVGLGASNLVALSNTGTANTAIGHSALAAITSGSNNTAVGSGALSSVTAGAGNIAIGFNAGSNLTTSSNNIDLGNTGTVGDSAVIRIGVPSAGAGKCFVAGIRGVTTDVVDAIPVLISSTGQLGTVSSSERFKENIALIAEDSSRFMRLRPSRFTMKSDALHKLQYGLIAEEVEQVYPELIAYDGSGLPYTVQYQLLDGIFVKEIQQNHTGLERAQEQIVRDALRIDALEQQVSADALHINYLSRQIADLTVLVKKYLQVPA